MPFPVTVILIIVAIVAFVWIAIWIIDRTIPASLNTPAKFVVGILALIFLILVIYWVIPQTGMVVNP